MPGSGWPAGRGRDQQLVRHDTAIRASQHRPPAAPDELEQMERSAPRPPPTSSAGSGSRPPRIASALSVMEGRTLTDEILQEAAAGGGQGGDGMTAFATLLTPVTHPSAIELGNTVAQEDPAGRRDRVPGPPAQVHARLPPGAGRRLAGPGLRSGAAPVRGRGETPTPTTRSARAAGSRTWSSSRTACTSRRADPARPADPGREPVPGRQRPDRRAVSSAATASSTRPRSSTSSARSTPGFRASGPGSRSTWPTSRAWSIDLSNLSFAGAPASATADDTLTDAELADLIDAISEADAEGYGDDSGELSDAELNAADARSRGDERGQHDAFTEFDAAFTARAAAERPARTPAPPRSWRTRCTRLAGTRTGWPGSWAAPPRASTTASSADFTAEQAGVEILLANGGHGPCGPLDDFGRCASRYHELAVRTTRPPTGWPRKAARRAPPTTRRSPTSRPA